MANEIITYLEMCQREGMNLQRGMNYRLHQTHSVVLMSVRPNAPYRDRVEDDGTTLIYEGHDVHRSPDVDDPKRLDQPRNTPAGSLTQNGRFFLAAKQFCNEESDPERVRVYEKLRQGIWSYNGVFHLVDAWQEEANERKVFKFKLVAVEGEEDLSVPAPSYPTPRRIIPTWVKVAVWKRDRGRCTICGSEKDLHFDHIIPWSKGGSSNTPDNIQLLCSKHNLQKHDKIE